MATQTVAPGVGSTPVRTYDRPLSERMIDWIKAHRQLSSWVGIALIVAAGLFVWKLTTDRRSEEAASRELQGARFAFENQNLPLAASELARVVENYSGTNAAEEGRLLLANVRMLQGQPQQAVEIMRDYAPGAGRAFRAQAYGLLGAAYENTGRFRDAAEAYENGSAAARLDFQKAQLLSDAGRAWVSAGDSAKAIAAYKRIITDFPKEGMVTEAKVRLGELTKGAAS
ncbi:MAG TPA: tetratricopeptide repeat protein [Gemmatimonadales bacterium]|nr:tetratricopeptide repeat protein [Gemmatimonadales bacterium]